MKSLSAAIVIAAGVYGLVHASNSLNPILSLLTFASSLAVIALGLVGWWACLKHDK